MQKRFITITIGAVTLLAATLLTAGCKNPAGLAKTAVIGVTLDKDTLDLTVGDTETLTAAVRPQKAADTTVIWSSNPSGIVTVIRGKITAIAAGTTTVTVTTKDGGFIAECAVTVTAAGANPPDNPDPNNPDPPEVPTLPNPPSGAPLYYSPDLLWQDEFDGDTLDLTKWNIDWGHGEQYGLGAWGNGEQQYYHADNLSFKDGILIIEARRNDNGHAYTSGKITTAGIRNPSGLTPSTEPQKFAVPAGFRVEASMKVPRGKGFWPAFWMLGENVSEWSSSIRPWVEWPRCGEIDIMETNALNHHKYGVCVHAGKEYYDGYWLRGSDYEHGKSLADDFYVYGVKWNDEGMTFYLQDAAQEVEYFSWTVDFATEEETEFRNRGAYTACTDAFSEGRFSIILNLAIGGAYVAWITPDESSFGNTPELYRDRTLQVDWVRVHRWVRE